jgi:NADP-dependent 3-hydroxy acid dehydrogenase YdfG
MTDHEARQRTAVVTGAGGGVGGRLVRSLAAQGWNVIAIVRSQAHADELDGIEGISALTLDLLDSDAIADAAHEIVERFDSRLDLLVHAAAVAAVGPAAQADVNDWNTVLGTNLVAPALLTGSLIQAVREAQGTVVFINSGAGERAVGNHAVYAASKHGLRGYADTLRLEESVYRVRVSTIYPGQIATKMLEGIDRTLGVQFVPQDYIDPQTVADAVLWVANATPDVHISNVDLRPRQEVSAKFNV